MKLITKKSLDDRFNAHLSHTHGRGPWSGRSPLNWEDVCTRFNSLTESIDLIMAHLKVVKRTSPGKTYLAKKK
jgi:hypothetical protein